MKKFDLAKNAEFLDSQNQGPGRPLDPLVMRISQQLLRILGLI